MKRWGRFRFLPNLPEGKDGKRVTGCDEHIALSRKAAAEGMVLLKNEDSILPLSHGCRAALFGKASADYVKGGGGSGDVTVAYVKNLCDGMEEKQGEGKLEVFGKLNDFYRKNIEKQYEDFKKPGETVEPELPENLLNEAALWADVAIISICRYSTEGSDRKEENDFYLSCEEQKMIDAVTSKFDNIIVVLNVGGMVDTSWLVSNAKIKGVLLGWQAGMEGAMAQADIICGDVCPSGRLSDTFAAHFDDYPSSYNFNESDDYVEYTDDIFVGYRYFETIPNASEKVNFPFGFGLSYTTFDTNAVSAERVGENIAVNVCVTNTGKCAGKQVVQIYYSAPDGKLQKPAKELCAFAKTDLLLPGESRTLKLSFAVDEMSSYDEAAAAYVLESGEYIILLGENASETKPIFSFEIAERKVTKKLKNRVVPHMLTKRLRSDGSFEELAVDENPVPYDTTGWPERTHWQSEHIIGDMRNTVRPDGRISLDDVADGKVTVDELIAQMSVEELITLVGGRPNNGVANTLGLGDLDNYDIPPIMTADGPAGLRINKEVGVTTTSWPCATLLACTFNTDIVYEIGRAGAAEVKENNLGMWLTPALNIHRSPLCGRNFEYFSEDPLVSGKMAAAVVKGIQSRHISACVKHFCCNNKETNRGNSDSRVSERALREIYLKGFEIAVKEAKPMALMTSYNLVNGVYPSENSELLDGILREEWGFDGLVTTDWNNNAEHYRELIAGNSLRMAVGCSKRVLKAFELGLITREQIEKNVKRILEFILKMA